MHILKPFAVAAFLATPLHAEIDIEPVTSPGGVSAWLVQDDSIPFVAIELIFPGGANLDADEAEGAVSMMAGLLSEGAGDLDAQEYAESLESLAGSVDFDAGRDTVSLSIRTLSENRDAVIDLARSALIEPRFDAAALERARRQQIASLERAARNPQAIASRAFNERAYQGHPYARPSDGTPDSVASLEIDDIRAAHETALTRDRVLVGAAGDISAEELGEILDRLLGDLPAATEPLPDYAEFTLDGGVTVIPHDGPQSVIAFGHAGIPRDDPDFLTAFVMNEVFGGGRFGTRLMRELRERRGLTYGVGTSLASAAHGDSFQGRLSTDNATAAEVVELMRDEWQWLADGGITEADLERIKTYLTGAYPLRFDGNGAIASILASMQFQGFDIDYVNVRNELVRDVTLEDVHRVAERLIKPDALHFIVVGQPEGLD
ncbi:MAG: zinc protease [Rhodobacteraceae bacterium HLUCCA12]|nr:MAG: zinc protease [Rhodobacteraceae bacterium HLUCCA12]